MNAIAGKVNAPEITFPFSTRPEPGAAMNVAPGVRWVRMPLPFQLNHINLWMLEDEDGWLIVDTGIASQITKDLWQKIFDSALNGKTVKGLLITHFHPDHFGLAGWLAEKWDVEIQMSAMEWAIGVILSRGTTGTARFESRDYDKKCGFTESINASIHDKENFHGISALPNQFRVLKEGDRVRVGGREWEVIIGEGHAPEHVCLWNARDELFISGDQVLARISPNISVWPENPDANPLRQFVTSIEKLRGLPASALVLPSHGVPFYGLHARLDELLRHHDERLELAKQACRTPHTVKELVPVLFGTKLAPDQMPFAVGETLAHLNYLLQDDEISRETRDGVWYFKTPDAN